MRCHTLRAEYSRGNSSSASRMSSCAPVSRTHQSRGLTIILGTQYHPPTRPP